MDNESSVFDTLTGRESIKVEHIVTTPVSTILFIVAGVVAAQVLRKIFA